MIQSEHDVRPGATRLAIFSDVHGNIHALEAVLEDIKRQRADRVYCLGDVVGYGAFPNEVIELLHRQQILTVMGNYDDGTGFDRNECGCAYRDEQHRRLGISPSSGRRPENKGLLRAFHSEIRFEAGALKLLLVHGSPRRINEYLFEDRPDSSFQRIAEAAGADLIVCGYTPALRQRRRWRDLCE